MPKQQIPTPQQLSILAMRISKDAEVPKNEQREFCKRISDCVIRLWDQHAISSNPSKALKNAASAARDLQQAFYRLNRQNRARLEKTKEFQLQFGDGEIINLEYTIVNLQILFSAAVGIPPQVPPQVHRSFAGVRFTVKDQLLRDLVFSLLSATEDARGKLTFNATTVSGSLAKALNRIRRHLPNGLVSDPLRGPTIQRLKTEFFKMRDL